jgi:hypothetical protein
LSELDILGITIEGDERRLRLRPRSKVNPELLCRLRQHKPEILALLGRRRTVARSLPGGAVAAQRSLIDEGVCQMPLEEFAQAGLVVTVYSEVLGETVLFASDNAVVDPSERRAVYRAAELREVLDLPPAGLRRVHEVKKIFGGTVEAS